MEKKKCSVPLLFLGLFEKTNIIKKKKKEQKNLSHFGLAVLVRDLITA